MSTSPLSLARRAGALLATSAVVAACVTAGGGAPATTAPSGSPSSGPTTGPSGGGFYLRAWQTQALAPNETFGWTPSLTISDGRFIDGMIAIPMVYPGPIYVGLSSKSISTADIGAIVAEASKDGLLGSKRDFGGGLPGGVTARVEMTVSGITYDLSGPFATDAHTTSAAPGTADAFEAFWNRISNLNGWFGSELGPSVPYEPERLAVMTTAPVAASGPMTPTEKVWPLAPFASFGVPSGSAGDRCGVVSGADLKTVLPVIQDGNALTRFTDSAGVKKSLQARVLMPGEPSPCG
jgi:hypothetical protein